jgi:hypothetical protein
MKLRAKFESPDAPRVPTDAARPTPAPQPAAPDATVSAAARNLALAHHLDRLIDRGLVADFTAAARMLGVSQPRLTHVMALLLLAPEIQAAILLGELEFGDKELRALARTADWREQMAAIRQGCGSDG